MPYNANIPQPTDTFSTSQQQIQQNFQQINNAVNANHGGFTSNSLGYHGLLSFNQVSSAPTFVAGDIGLYAILPQAPLPQTGRTELILVNEAGNSIPLTAYGSGSTGWAYLPSGILFKWGALTGLTGQATVNFPAGVNIPAFNNVYSVQCCIVNGTDADVDYFVIVSAFTALSITFFVTPRTTINNPLNPVSSNINYFALGD